MVSRRGEPSRGTAQEETSGRTLNAPTKKARTGLALVPNQPEYVYIVRLSMDWMSARRQHLADARATAEYSRWMLPLRQAE